MVKYLTLFLLCFAVGCTDSMMEEIRRGPVGSSNHIAPEYRTCKIVIFNPAVKEKVGSTTYLFNSHTIIEDDRGRRYKKIGKVGEIGDEFQMDVSLIEEIK